MRILHFDAFSGISGDMTVGALLDLGADFDLLRGELSRLPVHGYSLRSAVKRVQGIRAVKFDVDLEEVVSHGHEHFPEHHEHPHRPYRDIRAMTESSDLSDEVKRKALAVFARLAEAEAKVHGTTPEDVEFHEVGAVDSIVDVVGTAIGLVQLGVERITVSSLPLGSGFVRSAHGTIPVPGPATVELLKGFPVRMGDGNGELVTPTGAAILAALAEPADRPPPMSLERIGYGAGSKEFTDRPNLLRALLGRPAAALGRDEMVLIETNLDDLNPELFDYVIERLFEAGARDVWMTPIQMKKNRPGTLLGVLAEPAQCDVLAAIVLSETSAIGVRFTPVRRLTLPREVIEVDTELGRVAVKICTTPDGARRVAPEYESCRRIARERGVPIRAVYDVAIAAAKR